MAAEVAERAFTGEGRPKGSLGIAYDIHCKTSKTVKRSPLRNLAVWCNYLPLIGMLHGFVHARACQLLFLMLYIVATGAEDGEGCERYFNVTNALAAITRHQSIFHRRQAIAEFAYYHDNFETYAKCSLFIYNNYKQALAIIATRAALAKSMKEAGIKDATVFYDWLLEEGEYLRSLSRVPLTETLEMEYFSKLEALAACSDTLQEARKAWRDFRPGASQNVTNPLELKCRHAMENERKLTGDVQALEWKLKVKTRWVAGSEQWEKAKKLVKEASYRKALDKLEGLLVARIFEMSRLNVAGTGASFIPF